MLISILVLNYNRIEFIDRSLRSCLNQIRTQNDVEIIVVDDFSDDGSFEKLYEYNNEVKIIRNQSNMGVGYSSNVGLAHAKGDYFMRVDADDFISPFAVSILEMALSNNPESGYVFTDHFLVDSIGQKIKKVKVNNFNKLLETGAGILFRTNIVRKLGGYNIELRNCEDMELLLRLKASGVTGIYLPIPLYRYYIHGNNLSRSIEQQMEAKELKKNYGI